MPWVEALGGAAALVLAVALYSCWLRRENAKWRRGLADGTYAARFVFVENDGSVRELEPDQVEHLSAEYEGADGNRPYIKARYDSRTPDGRIGGYLARTKLPANVQVKTISEARPVRSAAEAIALAVPAFVEWLGPKGAAPDTPPKAALDAGVWRVVAEWREAGGGLFVEMSEASGRVMRHGATSTPRDIAIPLGQEGARVHEHYVGASDT